MHKLVNFQPRHILVCRTDALGDAILALPVCLAAKKAWPQCRVSLLVSDYACDLLAGQPGPDRVLGYAAAGGHAGRRGLRLLAEQLKVEGCDTALLVFPDPRVSWAVFRANIPCRVGTSRRWWSWLYNRRVAHTRSAAVRHEADYNLDLVRVLGAEAVLEPPRLAVPAEAREWARGYLSSLGWKSNACPVILHPGSRGSAAIWPAESYRSLAGALAGQGMQVLLTGSMTEQELLGRVAGDGGRGIRILDQPVDLKRLAALISLARVFVSGSTGPMHIAAGLCVPTVSFFPPAGVTGPVRWQPLGNRQKILTPPARQKSWDMADISVDAAIKAIGEIMP